MDGKKTKKFEDNFNFLEELSRELQSGSISVDELVPKMKKASESMKVCKEVLSDTKIQLEEIEKEFRGMFTEGEGEK
ncbi:MAG TPA: exodeoxyribonuclease VII small subunit [Oligoflexia bacterium]|nr:exodeoxyribonuclease VII small subunit [Oligoflexia bacterium]HMP48290.1 exodeoxyribonuclease VII small subunit [Oligoflexia bacterium]